MSPYLSSDSSHAEIHHSNPLSSAVSMPSAPSSFGDALMNFQHHSFSNFSDPACATSLPDSGLGSNLLHGLKEYTAVGSFPPGQGPCSGQTGVGKYDKSSVNPDMMNSSKGPLKNEPLLPFIEKEEIMELPANLEVLVDKLVAFKDVEQTCFSESIALLQLGDIADRSYGALHVLLAFNPISNNCGMLHYTSGGQFKIPVVIRGPGGVCRQLGAEHSQRLESYFQSIPGIQMVACSTTYNAKGLMKAAIRSDNPVILFEHVLLYNLKERIPDEEYICSLSKAEMVRPGEPVAILTYSRMRYHVMQAAKTLVNKGYDPEVIDIRSLKSFDLYTIGNSVKKTHRVLIVEECMRTGGIGASLTAAITENFHDYLDAPIVCLSSQDVPTPYAGTLEEWTVVQPPQIKGVHPDRIFFRFG
ncbi:LOW QUALITY PROTEIN: pyruvate dehydrogenase E1 component subunit beta-3, chloroplastic-like [Juglans microcarpa x Juglans regia]|uniref:LOW QUALITY PROTEIN: pyruvate dehydrogenase E1 component subunit beta-3, chloroplastic-like n=1 Tax=Juglans microcarpa x Juglans regia TaxID=2249226 RepID=UPI001B7E202C|nr:LOW QUALITY PROTEIN: pyruvate dehydrogenase E1 component subunit beta-3, chloroplastic-like [Juglans microcarpa x Juglans regia]